MDTDRERPFIYDYAAYLVGLILIIALGLAGWWQMRVAIAKRENDSLLIDSAGLHRMLSQKAALHALELATAHNLQEREAARKDLVESTKEFRAVYNDVYNRFAARSPKLAALYSGQGANLKTEIEAYFLKLEDFAQDEAPTSDDPLLRAILQDSRPLLIKVRDMVRIYRTKAAEDLSDITKLQDSILLTTAVLLIGIALFIFWPVAKRAEKHQRALRVDRDNVRLILDSLQDAVLTFTPDGFLRTANRAAHQLFNIPPFVSLRLCDILPEAEFGVLLPPARPGLPLFGCAKAMRGSSFQAELVSSIITVAAEKRILVVVRDISVLAAAEAEVRRLHALHRLILTGASYMIVSTDENGIIQVFNPAAAKMTGYSPEEVIGKMNPSLFHDPEEIRTRAEALTLELGSKVEPGFEVLIAKARELNVPDENQWTYIRKDGARLPISLVANCLRDHDNKITGYLGIATDISSRLESERQREAARLSAEAANRAKSEFLANMSHEIRTPMNGILGMTCLLLDSGLSHQQRAHAEAVRQSGESLLVIINDILDFSKIEAGKLDLDLLDFNLAETVDDVIELLGVRADHKGLELASCLYRGVPENVKGDPARIRQILTNLVGNAIKFTEKGEVVLQVTREKENEQGCWIRFNVTDTGIGLTEDQISRLFQAFSQADSSTNRRFGGTGLGLAISKRLVELMGGQIGVSSTIGKGSSFWFCIPMVRLKVEPIDKPVVLAGQRILIVDDNDTNREILHHQVGSCRMQAETCSNALEALRLLRSATTAGRPFAVAIIDMQMPEMNGLDLAIEISRDPRLAELRLIVLTSMGHPVPESQRVQLRIAFWLNKPVRQSQLLDCLAQALASQQSSIVLSTVQPVFLPPSARSTSEVLSREMIPAAGIRILLAEDHPINQQVALGLLSRLGCTADLAANGQEVLEATAAKNFDVILMDCQMPLLDGYDTSRRIRAIEAERNGNGHSRLVIIAMTAHAMVGDREKCLEAGMDDYISKPVRLRHLGTALAKAFPSSLSQKNQNLKAMPEKSTEPVIDQATLSELRSLDSPESPTFFNEIVNLFINQTPEEIARLQTFLQQRKINEAEHIAHRLSGTCGSIGASRLAAEFRHIELLCKKNELPLLSEESLLNLLQKIDSEYALAESALTIEIGGQIPT